ncbi:DUF805 domain-containing protein [Hafnia alvei]|uniref:Uncharacterized membrane protein YhaH, DUF805 family n=1 Tax=Hafnia alvei TaxID=569 RepID=A0A1C6Z704_HAFAL|nr:DUF805 domain-containing protein [Hafnia alvei]NLS54839.1 DUF805 domain-containing protein [Hafnia alvei]SCM54867.1 Uncharacterized membrane protein YhaH, DUF805 family [Hafnia alvei]
MFFLKNGIEGYRKAFCYKGVASRRAYFFFALFQLPMFCLLVLASFYLSSIFMVNSNLQIMPGTVILAVIGFFIVLAIGIYTWLAGLAFCVRRLHDIGLSGWVLLIPIIIAFAIETIGEGVGPIVNGVFLLGLMLAKSKTDNNKYQFDTTSRARDIPS